MSVENRLWAYLLKDFDSVPAAVEFEDESFTDTAQRIAVMAPIDKWGYDVSFLSDEEFGILIDVAWKEIAACAGEDAASKAVLSKLYAMFAADGIADMLVGHH